MLPQGEEGAGIKSPPAPRSFRRVLRASILTPATLTQTRQGWVDFKVWCQSARLAATDAQGASFWHDLGSTCLVGRSRGRFAPATSVYSLAPGSRAPRERFALPAAAPPGSASK